MPRISRRKLLSKGAQTIAAGTAAFAAVPTLATQAVCKESTPAVDYYQKLGVTPFINAAGTYTALSASTMPDEVQAAVALAAKRPVNLNELLGWRKSSEVVEKLLGLLLDLGFSEKPERAFVPAALSPVLKHLGSLVHL